MKSTGLCHSNPFSDLCIKDISCVQQGKEILYLPQNGKLKYFYSMLITDYRVRDYRPRSTHVFMEQDTSHHAGESQAVV